MNAVDIAGIISALAMLSLIVFLFLHIRAGRRHHEARMAKLHIHGMTARIRKHHDS